MKPSTIMINISRGQVVDQECMIKALSDGTLLGACLDVFIEEPLPQGNPLWQMSNVIVSPHSASTVETENRALVELLIQNHALLQSGQTPKNLYVPARGY
jgi:phosphoglycerate dehydrogenase-like enzyme